MVVATTYRRDVLTSGHRNFPDPVLSTVWSDVGAHVSEFHGEDDHLHLLVESPPQVQVSPPANSPELVPPRRHQFRGRTHRTHLWSPSYPAVFCGGAPLSTIRQYVENQHRPS
ncbi:putative transposase [Haloactinospora alba]|uniref:Putative transposase n=1 Tax=Haloactinospora alba TaxID=405555 RepID=A0A543NLL6_9ACTN|nr:putative transposase [Haloactinospora alba]